MFWACGHDLSYESGSNEGKAENGPFRRDASSTLVSRFCFLFFLPSLCLDWPFAFCGGTGCWGFDGAGLADLTAGFEVDTMAGSTGGCFDSTFSGSIGFGMAWAWGGFVGGAVCRETN